MRNQREDTPPEVPEPRARSFNRPIACTIPAPAELVFNTHRLPFSVRRTVGLREVHLVLRPRCQTYRGTLNQVQQTERGYGHGSLPTRPGAPPCLQLHARNVPGLPEWHEVVSARGVWDCTR